MEVERAVRREIKSDINEITLPSESEEEPVGMGSYTVKVKLIRSIPNILPIGSLKEKCTYSGVKKQCTNNHVSRKTEKESKRSFFVHLPPGGESLWLDPLEW